MAAGEPSVAAPADGKKHVSVTGAAFLGVGSIVGAGIFALLGEPAVVLGSAWQLCSVHFLREALRHVRKDPQGMVAVLRPIFSTDSDEFARQLVGDALEASPPVS
jgi:hypothetical protein